MQPSVIIRYVPLSASFFYGHMVAITTFCTGVGISLIVDPFFRLPSLIRQNFAAWSMSSSVILTFLTVIFSGIWSGLDGWAFIDWLLISCIVAATKKVIGIVQALMLLNLWSWFVHSWAWTDFRWHCFQFAPGHRGVLISGCFLVLLCFGCQRFYSLPLSPCSLHSYSSLDWCPCCIRHKTFYSNQLDLHPSCSFFPLPGSTSRHHRKSQGSDLEPIGRSKTKRLRQQLWLQLLRPAGSMPGKEWSRHPFAPFASSPSIDTNLTCQGGENRTSHSDFTEISEALLRRTKVPAAPIPPLRCSAVV